MTHSPASVGAEPASRSLWLWLALGCSAVTLAGSLGLSLGLGLKACPLCFYQRTFAMSLVAVLGLGLLTSAGQGAHLGWLALPLALAGLGIAGFHVFLESNDRLECPAGIFGIGSAPQQSLGMFVILGLLLIVDVVRRPIRLVALSSSILVGALLAIASSISNPPMPPSPDRPYQQAPEICRPPFRSPG